MKHLSQLALTACAAALLGPLSACSSSGGTPASGGHAMSASPPAGSTASTSAANSAAPDPKLDMPTVGQCRALRVKDVPPPANTTPPTDCSQPHTAITYAVGMLPASMDLVALPHRRVANVVSQECSAGFRAAAGVKDIQLTTIHFAYFVPTTSEIEQGAHWYRCDIISSGWGNRRLVNLEETTLPLTTGGTVPARYQLCDSGEPKHITLPCDQPHAFRAVALWQVSGRHFPGKASLDAAGNEGCRKVLGNPSTFVWQTPNRFMWGTLDMHAVACFKPDRR